MTNLHLSFIYCLYLTCNSMCSVLQDVCLYDLVIIVIEELIVFDLDLASCICCQPMTIFSLTVFTFCDKINSF